MAVPTRNLASDILIVNGVKFPCPDYGVEIIHSQAVDSGRNANGAIVSQLVGRKLWKINNLQWTGLDIETWKKMKKAIEPFFIPVTFTSDDNVRRTVYMYPSDSTGKPLFSSGIFYTQMETCKFNLIDCGW